MFKMLLCAAALASAAFAQSISITQPAAGTHISANSPFNVRIGVLPTSNVNEEVAVVIAVSECMGSSFCFEDYGLGNILYSGAFNPQSKDSSGNLYQDFHVTAPSYFDGTMQLNVAHFYTQGMANNYAELEYTNVTIVITGASG